MFFSFVTKLYGRGFLIVKEADRDVEKKNLLDIV